MQPIIRPKLLLTVGICIISLAWILNAAKTTFWTDELATYWIAAQPNQNWSTVIKKAGSGADGMLPAFYITTKLWSDVVHLVNSKPIPAAARIPTEENTGSLNYELVLRLPSLAWLLTGIVFVFLAIRKEYGDDNACISILLFTLASPALIQETSYLRAYGMLVGCMGIHIYCLQNWRTRKGKIITIVNQIFLILSHPLGIVFSALTSGTYLLTYTLQRKPEIKRITKEILVYFLCFLPALSLLALWIPAIQRINDLSQPWGWIPYQGIETLPNYLWPLGNGNWIILGILGILTVPYINKKNPLEITALILVIFPIFVWIYSINHNSLLLDRYMLPVIWGWIILGAKFLQKLPEGKNKNLGLPILILGLGIYSIHPIFNLEKWTQIKTLTARNNTGASESEEQINLPIYVEGLHAFTPRYFYNPSGKKYHSIINTVSSSKPYEKGGDVQKINVETKMLKKIKEIINDPKYSDRIVDLSLEKDFEKLPEAFLLIESPNWLASQNLWIKAKKDGWITTKIQEISIPNEGPCQIWKIEKP